MEEQKQPEQESIKSPQHESSSPLQDNTKESPVTSSAASPPAPSGNESNPTTIPESPASTQQQQETTHEQSPQQQSPQQQQEQQLSEPVRTLKEAFPDIDVEVIEAILASQGGQMERSFEVLLGMSDPNYKPEEPPRPQQRATEPTTEDVPAPPMPPRPTQTESQAPYGYWQQQQQQEPRTVEEQMQMDEAYARQLALEDERVRAQRYQRT